MKAIVQDMYGSADVLQFVDIDRPVIGDSDVLVRVHAASLHIGDWHVMTGLPYMLRIVGFGLRAPIIRVRGMDVAGTVESVGKSVSEFRSGDAVFGTCDGAFAEYACAPETNLAIKPANISLQQAAAGSNQHVGWCKRTRRLGVLGAKGEFEIGSVRVG